MSISSGSSPAPKESVVGSTIPPDVSSAFWSQCCSHSGTRSLTLAGAQVACLFSQSASFEAHALQFKDPKRRRAELSIFGQESNPTTWRLAKTNLAIRGIEANLGLKWADSFHEDLHAGLKADFVLANPPFNDSAWGGERLRSGERWGHLRFGVSAIMPWWGR
jgi:N-6 DNA methylase